MRIFESKLSLSEIYFSYGKCGHKRKFLVLIIKTMGDNLVTMNLKDEQTKYLLSLRFLFTKVVWPLYRNFPLIFLNGFFQIPDNTNWKLSKKFKVHILALCNPNYEHTQILMEEKVLKSNFLFKYFQWLGSILACNFE